jgi:transcriptional regulator with XRE-family HTH domain
MSRSATATKALPPQVRRAIEKLGADLRIARERRNKSLRAWAARMFISVPTLRRLEAGDPSVGLAVCATALWLLGKVDALAALAAPKDDVEALDRHILESSRRRK